MEYSKPSSTLRTTEITTSMSTNVAQYTTSQMHPTSNEAQSNVSETQSTAGTTKKYESSYAITPSIASPTLNSSTTSSIISTTKYHQEVVFVIPFLSATILGILVICICIVSIRTYKRRVTNFKREAKNKFTPETIVNAKVPATAVLYEDIEPEIEITFISPSRVTNGQQEPDTTRNKQINDSDTNPYVECPNNLYDKMFISRPHVNEKEGNVYQKVDVRDNRYSMVRPIGAETTNFDN